MLGALDGCGAPGEGTGTVAMGTAVATGTDAGELDAVCPVEVAVDPETYSDVDDRGRSISDSVLRSISSDTGAS
jgi:hypothetical protein